jgi:DNA helicase HerA-like ATPase
MAMNILGRIGDKSSTHSSEFRVMSKGAVQVGQFVQVQANGEPVLCQIKDLSYKPKGSGSKREVHHIGKLSPLTLVTQPFPPNTPIYPAEADVIRETLGISSCQNRINIGKLLNSDIEVCIDPKILNRHIAILGMTGSGKTYAGQVITEQLPLIGTTQVIIDPHNDFRALADVPELQGKVRVWDEYREPTLKEMYKEGMCTVIGFKKLRDVSTTPNTDIEAIVMVIVETLFEAAKAGTIKPFVIVLDECHKLAPQRGDTFCKKVILDGISEGRKFGMGFILLTQRPAKLDKDALSQCRTQIILKVLNHNDTNTIRSDVEGLTRNDVKNLQRLNVGEALVSGGGITIPVYVKIKEKMSRDRTVDMVGVGQ